MTDTGIDRDLGSSGLAVAPLVLGGNVFGWTADKAASFAILDAYVDGIRARGGTPMIDTADIYSSWVDGHRGGESETVIGEWLRESGRRDEVMIATKVGMGPGGLAPDAIARGIDASLARLGTDRIDLYFAHTDDRGTPLADTLGAFDVLVRAGKVVAIGASNYGAMRLKEAVDTAARIGVGHYSVLQPEYNLINRQGFAGELQDYCAVQNIGVIPYFGLAAGFLTGKYRSRADLDRSVRGSAVARSMDERGAGVLAAMDGVARDTGAGHVAIALAWLAAQPGVTAPIASASRVEQVDDLLASLDLALSADQLAALDHAGA